MAKNKVESWQAEMDAETLRRYQEIMDNPKRKNAAIKKAASIADDYTKRADALRKATGKTPKKK